MYWSPTMLEILTPRGDYEPLYAAYPMYEACGLNYYIVRLTDLLRYYGMLGYGTHATIRDDITHGVSQFERDRRFRAYLLVNPLAEGDFNVSIALRHDTTTQSMERYIDELKHLLHYLLRSGPNFNKLRAVIMQQLVTEVYKNFLEMGPERSDVHNWKFACLKLLGVDITQGHGAMEYLTGRLKTGRDVLVTIEAGMSVVPNPITHRYRERGSAEWQYTTHRRLQRGDMVAIDFLSYTGKRFLHALMIERTPGTQRTIY